MRIGSRGALAVLTAASLLVAACSSTPAASVAASAAASVAASAAASTAPTGLPYVATLKDGTTFTLNARVADKLAKGEPVNYVFSYGSTSIPLFSPQYKAGYERTLAWCRAAGLA